MILIEQTSVFLWTKQTGMLPLKEFFNCQGINLDRATAISADGTNIMGITGAADLTTHWRFYIPSASVLKEQGLNTRLWSFSNFPDYSTLPDHILTNIAERLSFSRQVSLNLTCKALHFPYIMPHETYERALKLCKSFCEKYPKEEAKKILIA